MPGSRPGERRGGRAKGTPNRRTLLREGLVPFKGAWMTQQGILSTPQEALTANEGCDSIDFLRQCYRNTRLPLSLRIDCAKVVAPFDRPRLSAITTRDGKDLPTDLLPPAEYRIWAREQIRAAFGLPPLMIEHQKDPVS